MKKHCDIEKITNEITRPCVGLVLKHVVQLGSESVNDKTRRHFHHEFSYRAKYSDKEYLTSMRLSYSTFLLLEPASKEWVDRKENLFIGFRQLAALRRFLRKVEKWFFDEDMKVFVMKGNKLLLNPEYKDTEIRLDYIFPGSKSLIIRPTIITRDDHDYEGIMVYLTNYSNEFMMTVDEFDTFNDLIQHFDLFLAGQNAIAYLQRPELGVYETMLNNYQEFEKEATKYVAAQGMSGRTISTDDKKKKGYFDLDTL